MALQPREKKLAITVGALLALVIVWYGWSTYADAVKLREGQIGALSTEVRRKQTLITLGRIDADRLAEWADRSLPSNPDAAASAYQSWLIGIAETAGLTEVHIAPSRTTQVPGLYVRLPFSFRARGTLAQTAAWLAAFYRADHLHQLRDLSLQPSADGSGLTLTAGIEALAMESAPRVDTLATTSGVRLDEARAAELAAAITKRNLFAPYVPPPPPPPPPTAVVETTPPPPPPPPPPAFDPAKFTILTSIVFVKSEPQAWLDVRPNNQLLKLKVGDAVSVGQFRGTLVRIGDREIEVDSDGKKQIVALGKALGHAVELPSATPTAIPTATPPATPTATQNTVPVASPPATPSATPAVAPSATPPATPAATPQAAPAATSPAAPATTPAAAPAATPAASPAATSQP